ncbi:glycosyltransferase family 2 protein [Mangrovimonas sp. TPBH4]|uniref:glycosyltransferase family 2 protein n=1 Tax=Mangrovimonas sp. TPBH4 TaxID=1645914 RepID=UPI0006B6670A|nr:glycosyltransferase family 2 protein [Mangrovimonas sp. TPBH4]
MPKVSIIVPNYNHEKFLKGRLESVLNQTFQGDVEVIILDDQSTDNSVAIIKSYQDQFPNKVKFVPSDTNSGSPFIQWDKGIKLATGDLIWIAESDDLASTEFLESTVPFFDEYPDLGIIVTKSNAINAEGKEISEYHPIFKGFENKLFCKPETELNYFKGDTFVQDYLVYKCLLPNVSGAIFRKLTYLEAGGLDFNFRRNGDYELYFRLLEQADIGFLNKQLNSTRYHDYKLTASNNAQSFKELNSILKPIFEKLKLSATKRLEIMSFYFTVYKYDIFLNDSFSFSEKLKIFNYLGELSGKLRLQFLKFLMQRGKITLVKKIKKV